MTEPAAPPDFDRGWAVFLDVDGTLLHLAPRPGDVIVSAETVNALRALQRATSGAVALISGRPLEDLDRLFAPLELPAAGLHGLERRDSRGAIFRHGATASNWSQVTRPLDDFAKNRPGIVIEDKGISVAVHYRLAPDQEHAVRRLVDGLLETLGPAYCAQPGKMVVEIKPAGHDKGLAIRDFMNEPPFLGRIPVFVGDDITDEDAFGVVNSLDGYSIKVGGGDSQAKWRLKGPDEVKEWLFRSLDLKGCRN